MFQRVVEYVSESDIVAVGHTIMVVLVKNNVASLTEDEMREAVEKGKDASKKLNSVFA